MKKATIYILFVLTGVSFGCKKESVFVDRHLPETTIAGNDPRLALKDIHLSKDTAYLLGTDLVRDSGQTLTIEAGTLVKVMDKVSIIIHAGAAIEARGTATSPIVLTSSAAMGSAGLAVIGASYGTDHYWQGISIYGSDASSGVLSYVRIEFAGGNYNGSTLPALLLQNVSRATTLENIQVSYTYANSAFEFNGGDCNARNLVSYAAANKDLYLHQGYKGMLQDLLAYRHPYFPASSLSFSSVCISDASTFPLISNLTILGPAATGRSSAYTQSTTAGLIVTDKAGFHIRNAAILGFPKQAWYLDNAAVADSIINGISDLSFSFVQCDDTTRAFYLKPGTYGTATSADFKNFMLQPSLGNQLFPGTDQFMLADPYNYNVRPDPSPRTGSPLLSGADFDDLFSDAFFIKVTYRGAIGTDNWLKGWTNFLPLQTNYNN
jgi:hypothetical protein